MNYDDKENSYKIIPTWSYAPSNEAEFSGKESDVSLDPNMNTEFR